MEIASLLFIIFCFIFLTIYWTSSYRFRPLILLIASILFYLSLEVSFGFIIIWVLILTYIFSLILQKNRSKWLLVTGIFFLIGTLVIFKYLPHWNSLLIKLFDSSISKNDFNHYDLPIGISFYIFQAISYLVDIFNRKFKPEKNIINFSLFLIYFPKIVAGPIERGNSFLSQRKLSKNWSYKKTVSGILLFTVGAFKKLVIADNLAVVVNRVFSDLPDYKGLSLIMVMFIYSWQIYADFSGYTDMARGISRMFGIELSENFNLPYISKSVREFWRRWHISFSNWLRDYLYFPLGGSRKGFYRTLINIAIVFTICGIWHGASIMFLIWGMYHSLILILERIVMKYSKPIPNIIKNMPKVFMNTLGVSYTFIIITISWILFRSPTISDAVYIFKSMFIGVSNFIKPSYILASLSWIFEYNYVEMIITAMILFSAILIDAMIYQRRLQKLFYKQPTALKIITYSIIVSTILMLRRIEISQFIYVIF